MTSHPSPEARLIQVLSEHHKTLATAESCTGGALANRITNVSGASQVFLGGVIAYSNELKQKLLKIDPQLIARHGAVSAECAEAMVYGLHFITGADVCVSITGIAGPTGGTSDKPVGTVFTAFLVDGKLEIEKYFIQKERTAFKDEVCERVAEKLIERLCQKVPGNF